MEIVTTYDRSALIERAIANLRAKLARGVFAVALVCAIFLLAPALGGGDRRAAAGRGIAFVVMRWQGINANIMSLGGIAIAIGAMVDAAVVMIENAHKQIESWQHAPPGNG